MSSTTFRNAIGRDIFLQKYAHDGGCETWEGLAEVLVEDVCREAMSASDKTALVEAIRSFKFLPGGRYLRNAGRELKFFSNCFAIRAEHDTREDWASLSHKAESCLISGGGIGIDYSVYRGRGAPLRRTGGTASGPIPAMKKINEIGRSVMQGGSRRSAIYASLNREHPDAMEFLHAKDWHLQPIPGAFKPDGSAFTVADAKLADQNFAAPLDHTNVSLNYGDEWLALNDRAADRTFLENIRQAMQTSEPGFSFNFGAQGRHTLRNAPLSGDTRVKVRIDGHVSREKISSLLEGEEEVEVYTSAGRWAPTKFTCTNPDAPIAIVLLSTGLYIKAEPTHEFLLLDGSRVAAKDLEPGMELLSSGSETTVFAVMRSTFREPVYCCDVKFEEHSFEAEGVFVANCTEFITDDDLDVCNLGSVNLSRIDTSEEFGEICRLGAAFLYCGTITGLAPNPKSGETRDRNRRIGLGIMGVHEWLVQRGHRYEVVPELHDLLGRYRSESERGANAVADSRGLPRPKAYRAVAPTGTIGMISGTTTGIEPVFSVAYMRRYLKNGTWVYQMVIESAAKDLIQRYGVDPNSIESALSLAEDVERRVKFQADVQDYVDMGISSTINLPAWGSEQNCEGRVEDFARIVSKYAPRLRGLTFYADGSRGGQPLTRVQYEDVVGREGVEIVENEACKNGVCGA